MTDEAKALVERLRWGAWYYEDPFDGKAYASDDPLEAADLIETQAREIERLQAAHREIVGLRWNTLHQGCNVAHAAAKISRAALKGDSHD